MDLSIFIAGAAVIVTLVVGVITIKSSRDAVKTARHAASVSEQSQQDSRATSHLDLVPSMRVQAFLRGTADSSPEIWIVNDGPVDAVQFTAQLHYLSFDLTAESFPSRLSLSSHRNELDRLEAKSSCTIELSKEFLVQASQYGTERSEPNMPFLMLQLLFRRESDRRLFDNRVFYFLDNEECWSPEDYSSINDKVSAAAAIRAAYKSELLKATDAFTLIYNPIHNFSPE